MLLTKLRFHLISRAVAAGLCVSAGTLDAQAIETISANQTVEGRLTRSDGRADNGSYFTIYRYSGRRGEQLTISLVSNDFDATLKLAVFRGTDLQPLGEDDDGGLGINARMEIALPSDGQYVIGVGTAQPNQLGAYSLRVLSSLSRSSSAASGSQSTTAIRKICDPSIARLFEVGKVYGDTWNSQFDSNSCTWRSEGGAKHPAELWKFELTEPSVVTFQLYGTTNPILHLGGASESGVEPSTISQAQTPTQRTLRPGGYWAIVMAGSPEGLGGYALRIKLERTVTTLATCKSISPELAADASYAMGKAWYIGNAPLTIGGSTFRKFGLPRILGTGQVKIIAHSDGVPIFVELDVPTGGPYGYIYVPIQGCEFQPYESKRP